MPDPSKPAQAAASDPRALHQVLPATNRVIARNTLFNLAGQIAPLLAAVFVLPFLVERLGADRFGLLSIAWMFLGYFSLFDLGMSRALTQLAAERLSADGQEGIAPLLWTGVVLTALVGLVSAVLCFAAAPLLVYRLLAMPAGLQEEGLSTVFVLAAALPLVISTASLRGILEAGQRFDVVNAIRIPMGLLTFLGPLLVLPFTTSVVAIVLVLVAGRIVAWAVHAYYCARLVPEMRRGIAFDRSLVRPLLRFGGWMTVSNLISPLMVYMDRLVVGAVLSVAAVAYYSVPWEVSMKLLIVPSALSGVLFPAFSYWHARHAEQATRLYLSGLRVVLLAAAPILIVVVPFSHPGLAWWLGPEYADQGFRVLQLLAFGTLFNGLATVAFAFLQGAGRPDVTAKIHCVELAVYVPLLWVLVETMGITGVALAWLLRAALDLVLLAATTSLMLPGSGAAFRRLLPALAFVPLLLGAGLLPATPGGRLLYVVAALATLAVLSWRYLLTPAELALLGQTLRRPSA